MTHKTFILSTYEAYLESEANWPEDIADHEVDRNELLSKFPHSVVLQVAYPELDFANRWCWLNFGPAYGECDQKYSEYRVCTLEAQHCHYGKWVNHWFAKTDYDFGFTEWYFALNSHRELFLKNLPLLNWGEHYPK